MGLSDVLLIEKDRLTSGSTWHAAGLVGQLRTSANITQLLGIPLNSTTRLKLRPGRRPAAHERGLAPCLH